MLREKRLLFRMGETNKLTSAGTSQPLRDLDKPGPEPRPRAPCPDFSDLRVCSFILLSTCTSIHVVSGLSHVTSLEILALSPVLKEITHIPTTSNYIIKKSYVKKITRKLEVLPRA